MTSIFTELVLIYVWVPDVDGPRMRDFLVLFKIHWWPTAVVLLLGLAVFSLTHA